MIQIKYNNKENLHPTIITNKIKNNPKLNVKQTYQKQLKSLLTFALLAFSSEQALANSPFTGSPLSIPGTIEAEKYDFGGQNVAYFDNNSGNIGNSYRVNDDVDIESNSVGGFNIGWFEPGEWLEYTVDISTAGEYEISAHIASGANGGSLHYEFFGGTTTVSNQVSFSSTGGWQDWQETSIASVNLNAGQHVIRVAQLSGGFNLNSFTLSLLNTPEPQTPYLGSPFSIPGTIQTEDYDNGGEGIAYHDTTSNNTGNSYRDDDVDLESASHGGYNTGYNAVGEWLEYTINVQSAGSYYVAALMASNAGGGSISFNFSGASDVDSSTISVGNTGNWQNWEVSSIATVNLNAGQHVVRLNIVSGSVNISDFSLTAANSSDLPIAYNGYTGEYSGYTLKYDDRFNDFNSNVWEKGDGAVGAESDCRFQNQGVQVINGNLELVIRNEFVPASFSNNHQSWKGSYNYSCGELRTLSSKRIKYGRIEARMKTPHRSVASGYISSLFTYTNNGSPREWEEIDVELEGGRPDKFQANLIYGYDAPDWNATRNWGAWEHKIEVGPVDQWKVFAIEWTPTAIKWFVDGVLVKTLNESWTNCSSGCIWPQIYPTPTPDNLAELMMNFWIPNDIVQNNFGGNKGSNVYPMVTKYDWIRIYQLDSQPLTNW
ncbi:MAG: endo-1,3-1,4-beta-glycanase ExoK [Alteromonadaceae bacterium]|jgi:endo-1,3-1,4-beta-glycanase ExoK